ncbi:MAG: valyl-tRNA synthetase [Verrucomicrobiales bacterium]|nr:valyl-tRNA synthetase [Verrucomicrobiales bacterium]
MAEISKAYEPQSVESKWYAFWLEQKCFVANPQSPKPAYSIVIPPPNVTGVLHMGHVLNNTIQDILSRKARMDGKEVLWLPGTDHAGIATEGIVAKQLRAQEKISKKDLGREEFIKRVWVWKEKHGGIIIDQLKKLGCSCDWNRERFTMDPEYVQCVTRVFVDLYKKGLIYRGKRLVNWCPATQTALSDEEVEMKPQKGFMYHFKVQVAEEPNTWLTIATTRPETIPGDTAVAVNPNDKRYAHLIGKHIVRPLPIEFPHDKKLIPIIGDKHVDFEFGTGVLKVTPAHDKADFEIGQRHKLELVNIMNPDASMNDLAGVDLRGLDRFEARKVAVEKLKEIGAMVEEKPYENHVGYSQRAGVPVEPYMSEQWFLKYPSVEPSTKCVADGSMKFHPDRWAKVYAHWLSGIQDWCISRQLWWGHRIPVWYHKTTGEVYCDMEAPRDAANWEQDADVMDTWFSSWLWPFATMGWPEKTPTLNKFYPTTDLVTGPDIIFFWVARMIMAGYEYMGEMPFRNVYFTGIIRDKQGRKMSKSLGNSPDPLDLIAKYGADALRFGVMRSAPLGQDVLFDEQQVELARNFCNKLWNACRFRQMHAGEVEGEINPQLLTNDDKWILLKLDQAIRELSESLNDYKFNEAAQVLYRFFWSEFCDWYIESCKPTLYSTDEARKANTLAVIDFVLSNTLRLFHPFLPFITEDLWQGMGFNQELPEDQGGKTIVYANWPKPFDQDFKDFYGLDDCYLQYVEDRNAFIVNGRNLRQSANIQASKRVPFVFKPAQDLPEHDLAVMKLLLNAETFDVNSEYEPPKGTPVFMGDIGSLFLPLEGLIDVAAEKARLTTELEKIQAEIDKVEAKLKNPAFLKAPANVIDEHRQRLVDWQNKQQQLKNAFEALS